MRERILTPPSHTNRNTPGGGVGRRPVKLYRPSVVTGALMTMTMLTTCVISTPAAATVPSVVVAALWVPFSPLVEGLSSCCFM